MQPSEELYYHNLYYQYAGVIDSVVERYAEKCPECRDDLRFEAIAVFWEACRTYDPNHASGASFKTWLVNQLRSITSVLKKGARGPTRLKGVQGMSVIPVRRLAQNFTRNPKDDIRDPVGLSDASEKWYLQEYGSQLVNGEETDGFPPEMQAYINALKGDSLKIFKDFCEGRFDSVQQTQYMSRKRIRKLETLNPVKIYRRLYRQEGWSLERVRNAWRGLSGVFASYMSATVPSMVCDPKFIHKPKKKTKCRKWLDSFKERHGITYGVYRNLVQKGVIPRLAKDDVSMDLSVYVTA